jgi:NADH:ubiquinone oxidoreductase subunit 6 (subunit J)
MRRQAYGMALDLTAPTTAAERAAARPVGFWISLATAALTIVTFVLAMTALPDDVPYPFTSQVIADQWPGDYLWMYPAMILMVLFVALLVAIPRSWESC